MRTPISILALLSSLTLALPLSAASIIEDMEPHDVQLETVVERPTAFLGMRIRCRATFVQTAALFDTFHTGFTPNRFFNLVVWDDTADIWDAEVRAEPLTTLYFEKTRDGAQVVSTLPKYTVIEFVGEVVSDFRGNPWIDIHEIETVASAGALTDNAVYHIERARELAGDGARELADDHFVKALAVDIPLAARISIRELQAENLLASEDYARAAEVLATALEEAGDAEVIATQQRAELHFLRAHALSEVAQRRVAAADEGEDPEADPLFEQAVAHAREAVAMNPEMGDAYAVLGISLAGLERFDEAKRQCQRAIRMLPENAEVRWYLGRIHHLEGDYDAAIEVLREAIVRAPKDYRLHKSVADSLFARGKAGGPTATEDIRTALLEYDIAIRLEPRDPDLYYRSGRVLEHAVERGQQVRLGGSTVAASYDHAIERFEACVAIDDGYTEAHVRLGVRYRAAERHDEAVGHYRRALELEPDQLALYPDLGGYLWELERRGEAYDVYLAHHQRAPEDYDTVYALGRLSLELDEDARAVEWLERVVREIPAHAMAHADLVESYAELGNVRESYAHAERALELLEDAAEITRVHRFAGLAAWQNDDLQRVIRHLDEHLGESEDPRLIAALGWALTTVDGRLERAGELAQRLGALEGQAADGRELLGWVQYLRGEPAAAAATLRELREAQPDSRVIAYRYGMALFAQGSAQYDAAEPVLQEARRIDENREILDGARRAVDDALDEIRDWRRDQERQAREAARERERAEREARRAAEAAREAAAAAEDN